MYHNDNVFMKRVDVGRKRGSVGVEVGLLSILGLGFLMGIKHAIEPDHVIAVSTIASRSKSLWRSSLAGVFWGIGHTATLLVVGFFLFFFKSEISHKWSMSLEFLVGIMLVVLGVASFRTFKTRIHAHSHSHGEKKHTHFHMREDHSHSHAHPHHELKRNVSYGKSVLIGFIHGLAGSAAMALLTMSTVDTLWQGMLFIAVFGGGTILGMMLFTTAIGIPFVLASRQFKVNRVLTALTGSLSAVYGVYYMYNLGVTEGLFKLWF
jgi:ABC-type nickel/cobalt efflux system permease component RcnA